MPNSFAAPNARRVALSSALFRLRSATPDILRVTATALVLLTPLFSIGESSANTTGVYVRVQEVVTPVALKALKDVGLWAMFVLALLNLKADAKRTALVFAPFFACALASAALSFVSQSQAGVRPAQTAVLALAGLRWLFPLALAVALTGQFSRRAFRDVGLAVCVLLLANACLQVFQTFHTLPGQGYNSLGVAYRPSGFFSNGYAAGFVACLAVYFAWLCLRDSPVRWLVVGLAVVSVFLSQSATAVVALALLGLLLAGGERFVRAKLVAAPLVVGAVLLVAPQLTARVGVREESIGGRLALFRNAAVQTGPLSSSFGQGTNTAVLLREATQAADGELRADILDSMFTSVVANAGWLGLIAFGAAIGLIWIAILRQGRLEAIAFATLYTVFATTLIVTEAWPMNLLLAVGIGYFGATRSALVEDQPNLPRAFARPAGYALIGGVVAAIALMLAPVVPYEILRARAMAELRAARDGGPVESLTVAREDLRRAIGFQPYRATPYLDLVSLAEEYIARGDWAAAVLALRDARIGVPDSGPDVRSAFTSYLVEHSFAQKPIDIALVRDDAQAARLIEAGIPASELAWLGDLAAWRGRYEAARNWYAAAVKAGLASQDFFRRYGTALYATGDDAGAQRAFAASRTAPPVSLAALGAPRTVQLRSPQLGEALNLYLSDVCANAARADIAKWFAANQPEVLTRYADEAQRQNRPDDAAACRRWLS